MGKFSIKNSDFLLFLKKNQKMCDKSGPAIPQGKSWLRPVAAALFQGRDTFQSAAVHQSLLPSPLHSSAEIGVLFSQLEEKAG